MELELPKHAAFSTTQEAHVPVRIYTPALWSESKSALPAAALKYAETLGFEGQAGKIIHMPADDGAVGLVLFGLGAEFDARDAAALSARLPEGDYEIVEHPDALPFTWIAAGWADGAYRFERYLSEKTSPPRLKLSQDMLSGASLEAEAARLLRDMVNTPADDMSPSGIEAEVRKLADTHSAELSVIRGDDLLKENYPMVHAVGRAAGDAPRIMELSWGPEDAPQLALVGKGVAFDSGGLDIKGASGMRIMKKDMGGAAHAIALASLVMGAKLPVRLKLYIPAVENAISGNAFRPGDILKTRKGLTVEIDNTDAEGRLILGDALARACESDPDMVIDFATLTGAARIALGPDLAPYYTDDEDLAAAIARGSSESGDPCWRMPLWNPYLSELQSPIADLVNSGGPMGGSITAALFLKQFVSARSWAHLDVWAWRKAAYGRPAGAAACGLRAVWAMLQEKYA